MFKSLGHFFATVFQKALPVIQGIVKSEQIVESVTARIPAYGPLGVTAEKLGYAVLGEIAAVLTASDAAAKAKLQDAGLDIAVIESVEALIADIPQFAALAKK